MQLNPANETSIACSHMSYASASVNAYKIVKWQGERLHVKCVYL